MSQSSAALNSPNPMKKKVITALIAVAIGHIGVLWAVSHIKPAELKPIEKKPLQVRFVKIQEQLYHQNQKNRLKSRNLKKK
ncbi:tonB domain protein [Acinetobacter baumannii 45057_1]|nr:tonB domain protein [Acinetobacter baumannii 45057_1]